MKLGGILNHQLARVIAEMGHTDGLTLADAGLPVPLRVDRIDLAVSPGVPSFAQVLEVVAMELRVEQIVVAKESFDHNRDMLRAIERCFPGVPIEAVPHEEFKALTHETRAVVRTGECTPLRQCDLAERRDLLGATTTFLSSGGMGVGRSVIARARSQGAEALRYGQGVWRQDVCTGGCPATPAGKAWYDLPRAFLLALWLAPDHLARFDPDPGMVSVCLARKESIPLARDRHVKIVTTLGPAVAGRDRLRDLMEAGADMVRVNAAHGTPDERAKLIDDVRFASQELGMQVPILFDLRGLKIRTGPLANDEKIPVSRGSVVEIVPEPVPASAKRIGIDYPELLNVIQPGSRLLISDGLIELLVDRVERDKAVCKVGRGGLLLGRQGVTLPGAFIGGGSLTAGDREDIQFAVKHEVDYLGLSFINDASDLVMARGVAAAHGASPPGLIAKIERPNALQNVRDIAQQADGIMVARGDLGVQLPPEKVPRAQKDIISCSNALGVPVITATQMLESMITQPMATRAETNDVANAVWDGTDAVMLSAESAVGLFPIEAVETMARIINEVERDGPIRTSASLEPIPSRGDAALAVADALARAAYELAEGAHIQRIVVFTLTGNAAKRIAKYRPSAPIIAVTNDETTARRLNIVWGITSITVPLEHDPDVMFRKTGRQLVEMGLAEKDEFTLIVGSLPMMRVAGKTNLLHIRRLGS